MLPPILSRIHHLSHASSAARRTSLSSATGLLAMAVTLLAGCTHFGDSSPDPAGRIATRPINLLRVGMSAATVQELMGKPEVLSPLSENGPAGDIWHYRQKISETVRQVIIGTRDVPAVNPITGQDIIIPEPVYSNEISTLYENIELTIIADQLVGLRRQPEFQRIIQ